MARQQWSTAACTARGCWAECNVAQEPPAQPWCVQIPVARAKPWRSPADGAARASNAIRFVADGSG